MPNQGIPLRRRPPGRSSRRRGCSRRTLYRRALVLTGVLHWISTDIVGRHCLTGFEMRDKLAQQSCKAGSKSVPMRSTTAVKQTSGILAAMRRLLLAAFFALLPFGVSAHGLGSTLEAESGDYVVDVGYDAFSLVEDSPVRFSFELLRRGESEEAEFAEVFVRIERSGRAVLAAAFPKAEFGETGLTFTFPSAGSYLLSASYSGLEGKIAEASFPLNVEAAEREADGKSAALLLAAFLAGLAGGVFLARRGRLGGNAGNVSIPLLLAGALALAVFGVGIFAAAIGFRESRMERANETGAPAAKTVSGEENVAAAGAAAPAEDGPGEETGGFEGRLLAGSLEGSPLLEFVKADYDKALSSGKLVVLYFYATWCPTCAVELPELYAAFDEIATTSGIIGFRVNFNDGDTDRDEQQVARRHGIAYQHTKVFLRGDQVLLKSLESWTKTRYVREFEGHR